MKNNQKLKSFELNEKWTLNKVFTSTLEEMSFKALTPIQEKALPIILEGRSHSQAPKRAPENLLLLV